jgi:hypothetical protein
MRKINVTVTVSRRPEVETLWTIVHVTVLNFS